MLKVELAVSRLSNPELTSLTLFTDVLSTFCGKLFTIMVSLGFPFLLIFKF